MVDTPAVSTFKCPRFDMCRLLALFFTCVALSGARGEVGFRQLFENDGGNTNATTLSDVNIPWIGDNTIFTNATTLNDVNIPWIDGNTTLTDVNATSSNNWTNSNLEGRIIGGQIAFERSQFFYQASLRMPMNRGSFHFCGATIIDHQHLLTAAHCVVSQNGVVTRPSTIFAVVGDLNVAQPTVFTRTRAISHIFTHHNFNPRTIQHDVAVLRVSEPFGSWTQFISPIPLAVSTPPDNTNCSVSGWGVTETGLTSDVLRFVNVPIVPHHLCRRAYGNALLSGMFCAGFMQGGRDACQGDSGGPLACHNTVAGIVSWGYNCARPGFPGVYANVATYRNWIIQQLQRSSSETAQISAPVLFLAVFLARHR